MTIAEAVFKAKQVLRIDRSNTANDEYSEPLRCLAWLYRSSYRNDGSRAGARAYSRNG